MRTADLLILTLMPCRPLLVCQHHLFHLYRLKNLVFNDNRAVDEALLPSSCRRISQPAPPPGGRDTELASREIKLEPQTSAVWRLLDERATWHCKKEFLSRCFTGSKLLSWGDLIQKPANPLIKWESKVSVLPPNITVCIPSDWMLSQSKKKYYWKRFDSVFFLHLLYGMIWLWSLGSGCVWAFSFFALCWGHSNNGSCTGIVTYIWAQGPIGQSVYNVQYK